MSTAVFIASAYRQSPDKFRPLLEIANASYIGITAVNINRCSTAFGSAACLILGAFRAGCFLTRNRILLFSFLELEGLMKQACRGICCGKQGHWMPFEKTFRLRKWRWRDFSDSKLI